MLDMIRLMLDRLPKEKRVEMETKVAEQFIELLQNEGHEVLSVDGLQVDWEIGRESDKLPESVRMYRDDPLFPDNMPDKVIEEYVKAHQNLEKSLLTRAFVEFFESQGITL